jgi:putative acetyltransferase
MKWPGTTAADMGIQIRDERPEDISAIRSLTNLAFGQELESGLIDALRSNEGVLLSLVAVSGARVVGHAMYSPASVDDRIHGAALGPMGVHPEFQRQGIGSRLVEAGNERIRHMGLPFIIVLGHPGYYPRFGFQPAAWQRITCEWDVPDEVFMLLKLDEGRMRGVEGLASYRQEFSRFTA